MYCQVAYNAGASGARMVCTMVSGAFYAAIAYFGEEKAKFLASFISNLAWTAACCLALLSCFNCCFNWCFFSKDLISSSDFLINNVEYNSPWGRDVSSEKIAEIEMSIIADKLSRKGLSLAYTDNVIDGLIKLGIDTIKGARGISQIRRDAIETPLANTIVKSNIPKGTIFYVDYKDDSFIFNLEKPLKKINIES